MLREQFLPDPFDPLGIYVNQNRVQAHARAFLVLSHAEIESYVEEWAKDIARAAETVWQSSHRMTPPLHFLLVTTGQRVVIPAKFDASGKDAPVMLEEEVDRLFPKYYKRITDNNGIKEVNLLSLLSPLGVPATAFGSTLLPNLDSFGRLRGTHAHHSAKAVVTPLDPETEYKRATDLVDEITSLDAWLLATKRRVR